MDLIEAEKILGLFNKPYDKKTIKLIYRKLAMQYHPDRNPNGLEEMKKINRANSYLSSMPEEFFYQREFYKKINENDVGNYVEKELFTYGFFFTIEGPYILVSGDTYHHRDMLKQYKFRWNPKRRKWYRPKNG